MKNSFQISNIIKKYHDETLSDEEQKLLDKWIHESRSNKELFEELTNSEKIKRQLVFFRSIDSDSIWQQTIAQINPQDKTVVWLSFSLRWVVAAAVIVFCLTISLYFYFQPSHQEKSYLIAKSIFADDEGATLILSDGSRVVLDSTKTGFLTTENGSLLFRDSDGALVYKSTETNTLESNQLNTVKTGYGQRFKIELPDETIVWLNTATTLIFPSSFSNQLERKVVLNGEAFFEVAKDEELPFIVHSGSQEVQVLGTQFNVEGYSDEPTAKTSLIEGSVRVINLNSQEEAFLSPGQQSVITDSVFIIRPLVSTNVLSWKNNYFDFDFANIKHVMQEISRWYNIEVVYEGDVSDLYFTGTLNRSKSLYETLRVIEHTNTIEYRMESVLKSSPERRLVIMKK